MLKNTNSDTLKGGGNVSSVVVVPQKIKATNISGVIYIAEANTCTKSFQNQSKV